MSETSDVLIVGGGAIGLSCALELAKAGSGVTLLERGKPGQEASWAGAGIVPPGNPNRVTEPIDRLRAESAVRFPQFAEELRDLTGIDTGFRRCGAFYYDHPDEPVPLAEWQAEGIKYERCDAAQVHQREPGVVGSPGCFVPDVAQVRNPRLIKALIAACVKKGVKIVSGKEVVGWDVEGKRIIAAHTTQESYPAGEFLVCGGSWTDQLLARFGCKLNIKPMRGQIVLYRLNEPALKYIHHAGPEYLVPRDDGYVLVGSTLEDVGFDAKPTVEAVNSLCRFAVTFAPPLAEAVVEKFWAGLRPSSPDGKPFLGRVPGTQNLSVAAGHFRWGIAGAPVTGRLLAELLTGQEPFMPLEPFSPARDTSSPRSDAGGVGVESPP
ncbi:MAG: glycine oxidase ThiO [Gemmataceae bacterium]